MGVLTPLATLTADLEKELVMGIERKKELKMLQTPRVNMLVLAFTGLPPAAKMKTHRITFTFNHFF